VAVLRDWVADVETDMVAKNTDTLAGIIVRHRMSDMSAENYIFSAVVGVDADDADDADYQSHPTMPPYC